MRRTTASSQSVTIARSSVSRTSPILPPSASSASATARSLDRDAKIGEGGSDRRMRLVHRHPHRGHLGKALEHGFGHSAGSRLDQPIAARAEHLARKLDHLIVADRVDELVRAGSGGEIDIELKIELEGLSNLGLVLHHSVVGV